jgi:hypothetical protein
MQSDCEKTKVTILLFTFNLDSSDCCTKDMLILPELGKNNQEKIKQIQVNAWS